MSPGLHDRMIVSWVSNSSAGDPLVMWGVAADSLNETAPATHDTYTAVDFTNCMGIPPISTLDSPFPRLSSHDLRFALSHLPLQSSHGVCSPHWLLCRCSDSCYDDPTSSQLYLNPGVLHNAILQPLQPARRYFYKFGSSVGGWSQVYSFLAPRLPGDATPFTFLYVLLTTTATATAHVGRKCLRVITRADIPPMRALAPRLRRSRAALATTTRLQMARTVFSPQ